MRPPGPVSAVAARNLLTVESQDRIFGGLVALSDMLEYAEDPALRAAAVKIAAPLATASRPLRSRARYSARASRTGARPALGLLCRPSRPGRNRGILVERLRIGYRLKSEAEGLPEPIAAPRDLTLHDVVSPLRANLTWSSAILRHAVRAVVLTVVAIAISLLWWSVYAHWLTITVALTMQPYFAATWQRALERIGGTLLGALLGGALAFLPQTTIMASLLMVPLSIIGFSVRQVSYGAYVACLTPLVVILFEVAEPGHSAWTIASMRTLYTIGGGIVAVLACMVLWPSWEPDRTAQGLGEALRAHARYAKAIFRGHGARMAVTASVEAARRACGIASNNLEASLSRALQEPRRGQERKLEIDARGRCRVAAARRSPPGPAARYPIARTSVGCRLDGVEPIDPGGARCAGRRSAAHVAVRSAVSGNTRADRARDRRPARHHGRNADGRIATRRLAPERSPGRPTRSNPCHRGNVEATSVTLRVGSCETMRKSVVLATFAGCLLFAAPSGVRAQDDDGEGALSGSPSERKLGNDVRLHGDQCIERQEVQRQLPVSRDRRLRRCRWRRYAGLPMYQGLILTTPSPRDGI